MSLQYLNLKDLDSYEKDFLGELVIIKTRKQRKVFRFSVVTKLTLPALSERIAACHCKSQKIP